MRTRPVHWSHTASWLRTAIKSNNAAAPAHHPRAGSRASTNVVCRAMAPAGACVRARAVAGRRERRAARRAETRLRIRAVYVQLCTL